MARWPDRTIEERFWEKVDRSTEGGCWNWTAAKNQGYGVFAPWGTATVAAYRFAYALTGRRVPDGLELDHLCRNPACVNPDHLEPVTHGENLRRAPTSLVAIASSTTHCPQGHPYDAANTYRYPTTGKRKCRTCRREGMRRPIKEAA